MTHPSTRNREEKGEDGEKDPFTLYTYTGL